MSLEVRWRTIAQSVLSKTTSTLCSLAFDQSLAMLRRARKRLMNLCGAVPDHIRLLQADLNDLPFRLASFHVVLCLNVLHQFQNAPALITNLKDLLSSDGSLYLTSLVMNNRLLEDRYLNALHAAGEFARPRNNLELKEMLDSTLNQAFSYEVKGNMAFATTSVT
ncbi:MAG: class I SAM-dependent methyltransferase [Pyrinomonadaceae bacterium]